MASDELCGKTEEQLDTHRAEYEETPKFQERGIPYEVAFCLSEIRQQPEDYTGPQRYCVNYVGRMTREEWRDRYDDPYDTHDPRCHTPMCRIHGRGMNATLENLEPYTAAIQHGLDTEDEHLKMDFSDAEQQLYDGIMDQWPDIYGWPTEDEDPARYEMLDIAATNIVRRGRAEDYLDEEGEVRISDKFSEDGQLIEEDGIHEENPIAGEYRLLIHEITNLLKELGLTPKERSSMEAEQEKAGALSEIGDVVSEGIINSDQEYDPDSFSEDEPDQDDAD